MDGRVGYKARHSRHEGKSKEYGIGLREVVGIKTGEGSNGSTQIIADAVITYALGATRGGSTSIAAVVVAVVARPMGPP